MGGGAPRFFFDGLPDGEREKYKFEGVDGAFDLLKYQSEVIMKFKHDLVSYGLKSPYPDECPKEFAIQYTSRREFGSLVMLENGILAVDAELKEIIENLEPDIHQFWPINISIPNGKIHPKQYYLIRIGQFLECFDPRASDGESYCKEASGYYRVYLPSKEYYARLAVSGAVADGAHLWRERYLYDPDILLSDALHAEIKKAGLKMPKLYRLKDAP